MYKQAIIDHNISLTDSFAIGDKIRDCAICESTKCRGFLIGQNEKEDIIEDIKKEKVARVSYAENLAACVDMRIKK